MIGAITNPDVIAHILRRIDRDKLEGLCCFMALSAVVERAVVH